MQNTGNFQVAASEEMRCPTCGAIANPGWVKCLSCKATLSTTVQTTLTTAPAETAPTTFLAEAAAKSKLPPTTLEPEDWHSFFTERSAILEHDGGLSHEKADRLAFESCAAALTWVWPTDYPQDTCAACGSHLAPSAGLPLADKAVVCNHDCHIQHMRQQRERAERQLAEWSIGVSG